MNFFLFFQIRVSEDVGSFCVYVNRTGGDFDVVGATYSFTGITATGNGVDYDSAPGTVTLRSRENSGCIAVNITNDILPEVDEVNVLTLLCLVNYTLTAF